MRKVLAMIALVAAIAAVAYGLGRNAGMMHAIVDSEIWTVDIYNPEDPEASAWGEYDQLIYIELDGEIWAHGMYQG